MSSSSVDKSLSSPPILKIENIIYAGIGWCVLTLLFFLLFSIKAPDEDYPLWYSISTYVFECLPFIIAALLCYRNWSSPQIASGQNVWLGIGMGLLCFFFGSVMFGWWELYWGLDPEVSPADLLYLACYLFIGWGMFLAVLPRRLNLESWQWAIVIVIALAGISLAVWVNIATPGAADVVVESEKIVQKSLPGWVIGTEIFLAKFKEPVNLFYIIGDVVLLIIATTLLLAFWGGRFSQSWRMIAAATFALYIADMGFKYLVTLPGEYESGGFLDIFFVFSGVLFALGAALEYDISSRPTRSRRRRGSAS
ncbi:MAG: hypothetical protein F6K10_32385 [Moorea sp. SIO2B7]|nr:hypothetical protein [Moorena sp. SIO2B7]